MLEAAKNLKDAIDNATHRTPDQLVAEYYKQSQIKRIAEEECDELRPKVLDLIPANRKSIKIAKGAQIYTITRVETDRRTPDDQLLMELLERKKLTKDGCSMQPDHNRIAALVKDGKITDDELRDCLKGRITQHPLVTYRSKASND